MLGTNEFPGDFTDGETPDPIPNSEAKPVRPMVVREGESRELPGIISLDWETDRGFPFYVQMIYRRAPKQHSRNQKKIKS